LQASRTDITLSDHDDGDAASDEPRTLVKNQQALALLSYEKAIAAQLDGSKAPPPVGRPTTDPRGEIALGIACSGKLFNIPTQALVQSMDFASVRREMQVGAAME